MTHRRIFFLLRADTDTDTVLRNQKGQKNVLNVLNNFFWGKYPVQCPFSIILARTRSLFKPKVSSRFQTTSQWIWQRTATQLRMVFGQRYDWRRRPAMEDRWVTENENEDPDEKTRRAEDRNLFDRNLFDRNLFLFLSCPCLSRGCYFLFDWLLFSCRLTR